MMEFKAYPWKLANIGDSRMNLQTSKDRMHELMNGCVQCLDEFMGRRLRYQLVEAMPLLTIDELVDNRFVVQSIDKWARTVMPTVMGVENRHSRNLRGRAPGIDVAQFSNQFVNEEAVLYQRVRSKLHKDVVDVVDDNDDNGPKSKLRKLSVVDRISHTDRAQSAFQICRAESGCFPGSSETHSELAGKFLSLPSTEARRLQILSQASVWGSRANRLKRKRPVANC
jgi:hypothetical protein